MIKKIIISICFLLIILCISSCANRNVVIIYSSLEDFRVQTIVDDLAKDLPDVEVKIQYYSTGTHAAKLEFEADDTPCDIFLALEGAYSEHISDLFYDLSNDFDTSRYFEDILPPTNKYHVFSSEAGCIILNTKYLQEHNLKEPTCYEDLLDPSYKGLIMMPNPKSSGTGFNFYSYIYHTYGQDYTLNYFEKLSKNVKQFSESGSGPVKAIDRGEIAIGLGMVSQAATLAAKNPNIKTISFEDGLPYSAFCMGIIKGHEKKENVMQVYKYLYDVSIPKDRELYLAEPLLKYQNLYNPYYPKDYKLAKMENLYNFSYREELLDLWRW